MKKVCIISKFPPVQGGIASRAYWRVREMLDEGTKVAVVTSTGCGQLELAGTSTSYLIKNCDVLSSIPKSQSELFSYHDVDRLDVPWRVQESPDYFERLLSQTLIILQEDEWDFIESDYLTPYGIVGHFASQITGIPHIVRHGASEIRKYLNHELYTPILCEVLKGAEVVITDDSSHIALRNIVERKYEIDPIYIPYRKAFFLDETQKLKRDITYSYIGKINYHWRYKALDKIIEKYISEIETNDMKFFAQGKGVIDFLAWAKKTYSVDIHIESFICPWDIPSLLSRVDTLLVPTKESQENEWGIINTSMLSKEAELMGCNIQEI